MVGLSAATPAYKKPFLRHVLTTVRQFQYVVLMSERHNLVIVDSWHWNKIVLEHELLRVDQFEHLLVIIVFIGARAPRRSFFKTILVIRRNRLLRPSEKFIVYLSIKNLSREALRKRGCCGVERFGRGDGAPVVWIYFSLTRLLIVFLRVKHDLFNSSRVRIGGATAVLA